MTAPPIDPREPAWGGQVGETHPQLPETHDPHHTDPAVTYLDVVDLVTAAQRRARWKSLITLFLLLLGLILGFVRVDRAQNDIRRNNVRIAETQAGVISNAENIEAVFRQQCELLARGFEKVNAATEDIAVVFEGAKRTTAPENLPALQRLIEDYRAKRLPIPDCRNSPTTPPARAVEPVPPPN